MDSHHTRVIGFSAIRMSLQGLWPVLTLSFVVALSGAIMPGPLFTYTIAKTVQAPRRGFLVGLWVTLGHAALEALLIVGLLAGLSELLHNRVIIWIVGGLGSLLLLYMGVGLLRDAIRGRVPELSAGGAAARAGEASADEGPAGGTGLQRLPSAVGGVLVSMSNPYWWIWWATVGSAFMVQYRIGWGTWPLLAAFFLGHEAGDLAWYLTISSLLHWGRRRISARLYLGILAACGVFIIAFAVYLAVSIARR
jgi:threonine/homoserine/homoserine lactone efflux protein